MEVLLVELLKPGFARLELLEDLKGGSPHLRNGTRGEPLTGQSSDPRARLPPRERTMCDDHMDIT